MVSSFETNWWPSKKSSNERVSIMRGPKWYALIRLCFIHTWNQKRSQWTSIFFVYSERLPFFTAIYSNHRHKQSCVTASQHLSSKHVFLWMIPKLVITILQFHWKHLFLGLQKEPTCNSTHLNFSQTKNKNGYGLTPPNYIYVTTIMAHAHPYICMYAYIVPVSICTYLW